MIAPGGGARDARINLKILQWHALRAADTSAKVRERLHEFDPATRPDAWAGTVQDGFARGFAVALEEAIALGQQPVIEQPFDPVHTQHITGKDLRKRRTCWSPALVQGFDFRAKRECCSSIARPRPTPPTACALRIAAIKARSTAFAPAKMSGHDCSPRSF